ncbi:hypothetical protein Sjap_026099 [Stephania japonica]|uniref:Glabrous enhancer-binding protein-like DBD domain-containing protein n=1 Tax=Stephania japonica TaxID=461633 RepID=A0AAP0EAR5_9MAGN
MGSQSSDDSTESSNEKHRSSEGPQESKESASSSQGQKKTKRLPPITTTECEGPQESLRKTKRLRATESEEESTTKTKLLAKEKEKRSKRKHDPSSTTDKKEEKENAKINSNQFKRSWTRIDELVLLKSLKKYKKYNNGDSFDLSYFYSTLKDSLGDELKEKVTKKSLSSKICRLRDKFLTELKRRAKSPVKPCHSEKEQLYNLSKEIWGRKATKTQYLLMKDYFSKLLPFSVPGGTASFISESKADELYGRWKKMVIKECEVQFEKTSLIKDLLSAFLTEQGQGSGVLSSTTDGMGDDGLGFVNIQNSAENLGEVLRGDRIEKSVNTPHEVGNFSLTCSMKKTAYPSTSFPRCFK